MQEVFGPEGLIARTHPEYEHRPGQIKMAEAVLRAFEQRRHLIVEAGTGTGKTLAYLVPAIAAACGSGARVVISTGTKNLQEQLMDKDIPFLQETLPAKFRAAVMKGRNNYACLHRIKRAESTPVLDGLDQIDQFDEVFRWSTTTETGDRGELSNLPENLPFWRHIDARSDTCLGQKCPDFEPCFVTKMRQRAIDADVVVVNHHLFFADLALRNGAYGSVLPDYAAVILDEAHQIEDVASEYFGIGVSNYQIDDLLYDVGGLRLENNEVERELARISARVQRFADAFWVSFKEGRGLEGRFALAPRRVSEPPALAGGYKPEEQAGMPANRPQDAGAPDAAAPDAGAPHNALDNALYRLETTLAILKDPPPDAENILRRVRELRFSLNFLIKADDKQFVYWIERRGRGVFLRASPIDVSGLLQDRLFAKVPTVILTSATLSSAGNFNFIRERLGLDEAEEMIAESIFDFENQAVLYLPPSMPDPRSPQWGRAAADEVIKIVNATAGRAFVLSTSNAGMNELYERVASQIDYPCFVQGSTSKGALLKKFRETPNAVLFATASFWQGVDVRGEQLSCVIIDKLPFAVPTDPVVAARQRHIEEMGGSSFYEYSVPQAVISLKQGLGRLIRSTSDRGVLAVLDPRLRTKVYGQQFLKSLPPCRITSRIDDLYSVFDKEVSSFKFQVSGS
ncbi:MAG TPA: helicase C-terminal domain-containing protein [Pyrinomonadaceae bacterium]|nr:helicase C-terminal domain-containing protein [Pyrinomonadaceae bacterium]